LAPIILEHLISLEDKINKYFPELKIVNYDWMRNPFSSSICTSNFNLTLQEEELKSLSTDRSLKIQFTEESLEDFWISVKEEYPKISEKALIILLPFSTSHLCELGFSTLTNIRNKKREKLLGVEEEMRVALSSICPCISQITKNKQSQISH